MAETRIAETRKRTREEDVDESLKQALKQAIKKDCEDKKQIHLRKYIADLDLQINEVVYNGEKNISLLLFLMDVTLKAKRLLKHTGESSEQQFKKAPKDIFEDQALNKTNFREVWVNAEGRERNNFAGRMELWVKKTSAEQQVINYYNFKKDNKVVYAMKIRLSPDGEASLYLCLGIFPSMDQDSASIGMFNFFIKLVKHHLFHEVHPKVDRLIDNTSFEDFELGNIRKVASSLNFSSLETAVENDADWKHRAQHKRMAATSFTKFWTAVWKVLF